MLYRSHAKQNMELKFGLKIITLVNNRQSFFSSFFVNLQVNNATPFGIAAFVILNPVHQCPETLLNFSANKMEIKNDIFFLNFPISRKNYLQCECSKTHLNFTADNMKITNMPIFFQFSDK